jgi:3-oxoacyl-[acyl-carrier protein] reductase
MTPTHSSAGQPAGNSSDSPRNVVITGASGGLGGALVAAFAARGDRVAACVRSASDAPPHLSAAEVVVAGDLTDTVQVEHVVSTIVAEFGGIDVLVHNAADQSLAPIGDVTAWQEMLDASLLSAVRLTSAMEQHVRPGGSVIAVSSVEAAMAFPHHAPYAAAKAALESYVRALAVEWGSREIRVNAVAPGLIERPGLPQDWPEGWQWWCDTTPRGRPVTPDEVAQVVVGLVDATGINGAVIPVDAGWSASARPPWRV